VLHTQRLKNAPKRALPAAARRRIRGVVARVRQTSLLAGIRQLDEFRSDAFRYAKHACWRETPQANCSPVQLEAQLTRDYHRVEKGLAFANPKRPFGSDVLVRLDALIPLARQRNPGRPYLIAAESARAALTAWNSGDDADTIVAPIAHAANRRVDVECFFTTRHSVRDFSTEYVSPRDIRRAVELAAFSPSACNRQPWKVRLFFGDDVVRVLAYQNGNRGFARAIPALALVSVELGQFVGAGERNQAWIEGGIFGASMVWALHGIGLQSCMLNLSVTTSVADELRDAVGMPASEVPIMMIAIGHGRPGHRIARSPRRSAEDLIIEPD
jgi:nitroreductase